MLITFTTMHPPLLQPTSAPASALPDAIANALVASALSLRSASPLTTLAILRGKRLALLCETEPDMAADLFCRAAWALGAEVSHVRPGLAEPAHPAVLRETARTLGRLYDGIECRGLAAAAVDGVRLDAGVPVWDGLSGEHHATALLDAALGGVESLDVRRQLIVEAVLVDALR